MAGSAAQGRGSRRGRYDEYGRYTQYMNGNAAVELGQQEPLELPEEEPRPQFTVLPGSGAERRAREQQERELAPLVVTALKCAAAFAAVLVVVALARILVIALAYGYASSNNDMVSRLDDLRSQESELEVQQSVYGSSERVLSLATSVYGMVPAESVTVVDVSPAEEEGAPGQAGDASPAE